MADEGLKGALPADTDVLVAGGGPVGLALAALLADCRPDRRVTVVEAEARPRDDGRAIALSESGRAVLAAAGAWPALRAHAAPIREIHVSQRGGPGVARLSAVDLGASALGHVVTGRDLLAALEESAARRPNVQLCRPVRVAGCRPERDAMVVEAAEGGACRARLAVLAGGAGTGLLRRLGIAVYAKDYRRAALVTVVALDRAHRGTAWERFAPEGPLALLPLPDSPAGEPRAAVVWTLEPARAEALAAAPEDSFLAALGQAFGHRAGRFRSLLAPRGRWPLGLQLAREQVRSRLAVVGNAAHALHPVAGQGFNLALRNAARLAAAVAESEDPGDLGCLEGYLDEALPDQRRVLALSDSLPSLFALTGAAPTLLRGFALAALDLAPPLRRGFARLGSGLPSPVVPLAP